MAIAKDNTWKGFSIAGGQTSQLSDSQACAGTNRYLIAGVYSGASGHAAPTDVKWGGSGGAAMTQIGARIDLDSFWTMSLWGLVAPTVQTSTVYALWAGAQDETAVIATSYTDVDQGSPLGALATKQEVFATGGAVVDLNTRDATNVCTTVSGDMMVDVFGLGTPGGSSPTLSVQGGQTSDQEYEGGILSAYDAFGMSHLAASGTSTSSIWRLIDTTQLAAWGMYAIALKLAGTATPPPPENRFHKQYGAHLAR